MCLHTEHLEKCKGAIPHFWAKITPNLTILAKSHFWAKIVLFLNKNPLFPFFCTFLDALLT